MAYSFKPLILSIACLASLAVEAKVAFLAWDSLVELPGNLSLVEKSGFKEHGQTGPELPLTYARKASDGRLALVVSSDPDAKKMRTYYATYAPGFLKAPGLEYGYAAYELHKRVGTTLNYVGKGPNSIMYSSFANISKQTLLDRETREAIWNWSKENGFDSVMWSEPSIQEASTIVDLKKHLDSLCDGSQLKTYCEFRLTPKSILNRTSQGTELMRHVEQQLGTKTNIRTAECKRLLSNFLHLEQPPQLPWDIKVLRKVFNKK